MDVKETTRQVVLMIATLASPFAGFSRRIAGGIAFLQSLAGNQATWDQVWQIATGQGPGAAAGAQAALGNLSSTDANDPFRFLGTPAGGPNANQPAASSASPNSPVGAKP